MKLNRFRFTGCYQRYEQIMKRNITFEGAQLYNNLPSYIKKNEMSFNVFKYIIYNIIYKNTSKYD